MELEGGLSALRPAAERLLAEIAVLAPFAECHTARNAPVDAGPAPMPEGVRSRCFATISELADRAWKHRRTAVLTQDETSPRLNIFHELGVARREVKTHSRLLRLLFDPQGEHRQGSLFLRSFLSHLEARTEKRWVLAEETDPHWRVMQEVYCGPNRGYADLVLHNPVARMWIVIENKIDAEDQSAQLSRYWSWLSEQPRGEGGRTLCYLTIDGRTPSRRALWGATRSNLEPDLLLLSYRADIAHVLKTARARVRAPAVQMIVDQYLSLIRSL